MVCKLRENDIQHYNDQAIDLNTTAVTTITIVATIVSHAK